MPKPDVDLIAGLSPSISISQKSTGKNPRSTVGTITEIYDYLRVLYARVGQGHCSKCGNDEGTLTYSLEAAHEAAGLFAWEEMLDLLTQARGGDALPEWAAAQVR